MSNSVNFYEFIGASKGDNCLVCFLLLLFNLSIVNKKATDNNRYV